MADIKISVINSSTVLTDDQVKPVVDALQTQVHRDFYPPWGIDADLAFVPSSSRPPSGSWWLAILDDSDQAGALGYHDVTNEGLPMGKAFAGSDINMGYQWPVTTSHELLEMLADPEINLTVFVQPTANSGTLYAYEVCDACEADEFGYKIGNAIVSDFVYPAWFESSRQSGSTQFDFGNQISKPLQLLKGGYIGTFDVKTGSGWHQLTNAGELRYDMRPRVGSRRERRRTSRDEWMKSTVQFSGRGPTQPPKKR